MQFIVKSLVCLFSICTFSNTFSQDTRIETYSFSSQELNSLEIDHSLGNIEILHSDSDSISFIANYVLTRATKEKVVSFANANMIFDIDDGNLKGQQFLPKDIIWGQKILFQINCKIFIPKNIPLKIRNRSGDITILMPVDSLHIVASNGKILLDKNVEYLNADLNRIEMISKDISVAELQCENSNLQIKNISHLQLDSESSSIDIHSCNLANIHAQHSNINFVDIKSLSHDAKFGSLEIKTISQISTNTKHTSIEINNLVDNASIQSLRDTISIFHLSDSCRNLNIHAIDSYFLLKTDQRGYHIRGEIVESTIKTHRGFRRKKCRKNDIYGWKGNKEILFNFGLKTSTVIIN